MAKNRRPQTQKPAAMRSGSKDRMAMSLRNGDGFHRVKTDYRKPKYGIQSLVMDY